jgi:hypothetical protein
LELKIAQKCELSDESAIHHFHSARKNGSQDATFFAGCYQPTRLNNAQEESHETSPQPDLPDPSFLFLLREGGNSEIEGSATAWRPPYRRSTSSERVS